MSRLGAACGVAVALLVIGMTAEAVPARELAARAASAEARQDWNAAARALEELRAAGLGSSDVLYDLGTVYVQAERYGEAIYCLEQVVRRAPWSFAAQRNLRAARVRLARRDAARTGRAVVELQPPPGVQLGEALPYDVVVPVVVLAELLVLAAWWYRRRSTSELRRVGAAVVLILAAVVGAAGLVVVVARRLSSPAAIVLRDGLRLLQTPRNDAIPDEPVREGERVDVARHEGEFVRVRTLAGHVGWLAGRDVGMLEE